MRANFRKDLPRYTIVLTIASHAWSRNAATRYQNSQPTCRRVHCRGDAARRRQPVILKCNSSTTILVVILCSHYSPWVLREGRSLNAPQRRCQPRPLHCQVFVRPILHLDCAEHRLGAVEAVWHNLHGVHSPSHPTSLSLPPRQAHQPGSRAAWPKICWGPNFEIWCQPYFQNRVVVSWIYTHLGSGPSGACYFFCLATRKRGAQRAKFQTAYKKDAYKSRGRVLDIEKTVPPKIEN